MSTASLYPQIISELDQLRKRWRQVELLKAIGLVLARIVLLWLVFGVIDGYLKFSSSGRVLAGTVLWGSAIIWVWSHIVQLFLIEHRDDYFAMLVEEKHPELHNRLINALQLGRGHVYGSPRLVEAVISDARQATSDLDLPACAPWQNARQAAAIAGGTVLLLLIVSVFPRISTGLARIIFPWTDRAPYSYTTIIAESIKPLDRARYPEGSDLTFEVQLAGETSATATLWYSTDGEQWRTQNMNADPRDPTRFAAMLPAVNQSLTHYVAAGDAESNMRTVEIVPRPRIEKLSVGYRYPEYAQQPAQQPGETSGDLAALLGSHVELVVECSKPLRKAFLQTDGGLSLPLTISADNAKSARIRFLLGSEQFKLTSTMNAPLLIGPTRYQLQLTDTDGYDNRDALWHSITPLPDHPPQITWLKPGRDIQAKPDDTVKLSLQSRDDIGLAETRIVYRVNEQSEVVELQRISQERLTSTNDVDWELSAHKLRPGDSLQYWAVTTDRNTLTGAGVTESRKFSITLIAPEQVIANLDLHIEDYAAVLEELIRLQRENRAQTSAGSPFDQLILREQRIRMQTQKLARVMEQDSLPTGTMVGALDELYTGAMAEVIRIFENGKGAAQASVAEAQRQKSIPLQDEIIRVLEELLARLERNDQARKALKKLQQGDAPAHQQVTESLQQLITQLDQLVNEKTELIGQLEKLPKKPVDEHDEEEWDALKSLEAFNAKWGKWAKGSVNELGKLPTGFVDDFGLRKDVNTVYEEIEAAAQRPKSSPLDVALEDLGSSKATEMLEDLETWMLDTPDATQWRLEEPLDKQAMNMPEMPLPDALEDLIGDLLQDAEEFDEEADDLTSAWGDNLNQAGWGTSDGPISSFSAKGKTGNDLPNSNELNGRSGDGRRGKSSGQMVGDTSRGLEGRPTPARLNNERYEPGRLKEEGKQDPNGATGGGKKAGAGQKGLQGGTPPDFVRDMERLNEKQAGLREKAELVAKKLDTQTIIGKRLSDAIQLMKSSEQDVRDRRYDDAARKRKVALSQLRASSVTPATQSTVDLKRARELPQEFRQDLLQSTDDGYPKGYERLLENYFRTLSEEPNR